MAEPVISAVVGEVVQRATSFITGRYYDHTSMNECLDRTRMHAIKIESAIEASKTFDISNEPLREWVDKMEEVLSEGHELHEKLKNIILLEGWNLSCSRQDSSSPADDRDSTSAPILTPVRDLVLSKEGWWRNKKGWWNKVGCYCRSFPGRDVSQPCHIKQKILELIDTLNHLFNPYGIVDLVTPKLTWILKKDEQVSKLIKLEEKLERISGDIGDFLELLKLQQKRKMRKRRYRPYSAFFGIGYPDFIFTLVNRAVIYIMPFDFKLHRDRVLRFCVMPVC